MLEGKRLGRFIGLAACAVLSGSALLAGEPPAARRLLVKLDPAAAAEIEQALPLDTLALDAPALGSTSLARLVQSYGVHRVRPVYGALVRRKRQTGLSERAIVLEIRQRFGRRAARRRGSFDPPELGRTYVFEVPGIAPAELLRRARALRHEAGIEYAEPDYIASISLVPNDPYFGSTGSWGQAYDDLYGIKKVQAPAAWDTTAGAGAVVAVVDTGLDFTHPDLGPVWTNPGEIPGNGIDDDGNGYVDDVHGWDFTGVSPDSPSDNDPNDEHGHGTHVAGTIAAAGNNGVGVIGVAWQAQIMPVRGLDAGGSGDSGSLALALMYAASNGADIISNSWGCGCYSQAIADAVSYAQNLGAVVVAAAGNSNADTAAFSPASLPGVIAVASLSPNDTPSSFSNYGSRIDVAAPGEDVLSLRAAGTSMGTPVGSLYTRASGTSMAAPHVSGVAALVLSQHPEYSNDQVREILRMSATDLDAPGFDTHTGYGRVNAAAALGVTSPLAVHITAPSWSSHVSVGSAVTIRGRATGTGFVSYTLEYGAGELPTSWTTITTGNSPVDMGTLGVLDTTGLAIGTYTLRLTAQNAAAQTFVDRVVFQIFVPPTVTITAPANGAALTGIVTVTAQTTGTQIFEVDLYVDDVFTAYVFSSSFSYDWNTAFVDNGSHTLRAEVWDSAYNGAISPNVTVTTTNPPPIVITAPGPGTLSGPVTVTAQSNAAPYAVQLFVDNVVLATLYGAPYTMTWPSGLVENGPHTLTAKAYFWPGSRTSDPVAITTNNPPHASYDATLEVPLCAANSGVCDSGPLLVGRGSAGPETNAPNTLQGTCADGNGGNFHYDESNERIRISTQDGGPFAPGKIVNVDVTVWAWSAYVYSSDYLDLFYTTDVSNPGWTLVGTVTPDRYELDTLSFSYQLKDGERQAVRAQFRHLGAPNPCDQANSAVDHDDLAFTTSSALDHTQLRIGAVVSGGALGAVTPTQTVKVHIPGPWSVSVDQPFLSVVPASGNGNGTIDVQLANTNGLPAVGDAQAIITVTSPSLATPGTITVHVKTYAPGTTSGPTGLLEAPPAIAPAVGAIPVTGWAVDDVGVGSVRIYRDAVAGDVPDANGQVYIGDAVFVSGVRPDIEQGFDRPMSYRAAWGYMLLTNLLPNTTNGAPAGGQGVFTLRAYGIDIEGHQTLIGTSVIIVDNAAATKPFGTIDTPFSGQVVQGTLQSFGWVLTPQPAQIATDGSTITLYIDGQPRGTADYNLPRNDITTLFPGYANSAGPIAHFAIDTTQLTNGVHTMFWIVTDSLGHGEGIGSRYFYVAN